MEITEENESMPFLINNWEYKVVWQSVDMQDKELHARLIHDSLKHAGIDEWIVVSDISEMKLWRFNKLVKELYDIGHKLSLLASVSCMEIVFRTYGVQKEEGDK